MQKLSDPAETLFELQNQADTRHFWNSSQTVLLLLAIILLAAVLFLWAAYFRKPRRRVAPNELVENPVLKSWARSRRRRKSKRRNPTLAETGGLPPRKQNGVPNHH